MQERDLEFLCSDTDSSGSTAELPAERMCWVGRWGLHGTARVRSHGSAFPGLLTCSASVSGTWKCPGFVLRVKSSYASGELGLFLDDLFLKRKIHSDFKCSGLPPGACPWGMWVSAEHGRYSESCRTDCSVYPSWVSYDKQEEQGGIQNWQCSDLNLILAAGKGHGAG